MQNSIDEFESMFRRAEREAFLFENIKVEHIAVVTDQPSGDELKNEIKAFIPRFADVANWSTVASSDYADVDELLDRVNDSADVVVTYRHLRDHSGESRHSLGAYLDALTQATSVPVLVLPGSAVEPRSLRGSVCQKVMVVTDHISGDNLLVNFGARMCSEGGTVFLCHVEDDAVLERYLLAIERIPEINSEEARELISEQLLKESSDFVETCIAELGRQVPKLKFEAVIEKGHHLKQYKRLIESHSVNLVIANTKDEDQLAMHGLAYSLAVEMVETALLLL